MKGLKTRFDIRQAGRHLLTGYLALLVVSLLFYVFLVRPKMQEYLVLSEENSPRVEKFRREEADVKAREEYLAALQRAEADLNRLRSEVLLTRAHAMIGVQLELARLARQFNINLQKVQYSNEKFEEEAVERFAMVVPLEGGYANLRKFLQAVESSQKFLVVEQVGLGTGRAGGVLLELNITLVSYFDDPEARLARPARRTRARRA
jgi:Tfp pilus assembly protein PilO